MLRPVRSGQHRARLVFLIFSLAAASGPPPTCASLVAALDSSSGSFFSVLTGKSADPASAIAACSAFSALTASPPLSLDDCMAAGAPRALVGALRSHASLAAVVSAVVEAMGQFITAGGARATVAFVEAGVVSSLVAASRRHEREGTGGAGEAAARALLTLGYTRTGTTLVSEGIAEVNYAWKDEVGLIDAVRRHVARPAVVAAGARFLRNFLVNTERRVRAVKAGALPVLVDGLVKCADDADVAVAVSSALRAATVGPFENEAIDAGAAPALATALRLHAADVVVVETASGALANIATAGNAARDALVSANIPSLLVSVLDRHSRNSVACAVVAAALRNIALGERTHRAALTRSPQFVSALLGALKIHDGKVAVVTAAAGALENVCFDDMDVRARVRSGGGIASLVNALRVHGADSGAVAAAAGALRNLCAEDQAAQGAAFLAGALPLLLSALESHIRVSGTVAAVAGALRGIASENVSYAATVATGARSVVGALKLHVSDARTAEALFTTVVTIADVANSTTRGIFLDAGTPQLLVEAMDAHAPMSEIISIAGAESLRLLSVGARGRAAVVDAGAPRALTAVLTAHPQSPMVADAVAGALIAFFRTDDKVRTRRAVEEAGAVPLLVNSLRTHGAAVSLVENALIALGFEGEVGDNDL